MGLEELLRQVFNLRERALKSGLGDEEIKALANIHILQTLNPEVETQNLYEKVTEGDFTKSKAYQKLRNDAEYRKKIIAQYNVLKRNL